MESTRRKSPETLLSKLQYLEHFVFCTGTGNHGANRPSITQEQGFEAWPLGKIEAISPIVLHATSPCGIYVLVLFFTQEFMGSPSTSHLPFNRFVSRKQPLRLLGLGHGVECTAILEPLNLGLVEGVLEFDVECLAVLRVNNHGNRLANCEFGREDVNLFILSAKASQPLENKKHTLSSGLTLS